MGQAYPKPAERRCIYGLVRGGGGCLLWWVVEECRGARVPNPVGPNWTTDGFPDLLAGLWSGALLTHSTQASLVRSLDVIHRLVLAGGKRISHVQAANCSRGAHE